MEKHTDNLCGTENGGKMPELAAGEGFTIFQAPSCPSYEYPDDLENELFAPTELVDKGEERIELAADHIHLPEFVKRRRVRNKYRYNIYRLDEEEGKKQYVYHARKPNMDLVHAHTRRSRPRYLYRVWCSASAGYNSDGEFKSGAAHNGLGAQDMALWKAPEVQHHLLHHVSGMRNDFQSHFISFTNSGLFAECKATKRKEMNKKELKDLLKKAEGAQGGSKTDSEIDVTLACQIAEAKESLDVRISMIDMHDFPDDVVMFNAQALMRAHNLEETSIGVTGPAHHSEFLIWDGLKVPMQTVSLSALCTPVIPGENRQTTQLFYELQPHIYQTIDKYTSLKRKREAEARTAPGRTRKPSQIRPALYDGPEAREANLQIRSNLVMGHRMHYKENMANAFSQGTKNHESFNKVPEGSFGAYDLRRYIGFIQNRFKPKYQLPMLAMMLSLRTAAYFRDDMVEEVKRVKGLYPEMTEGYEFHATGFFDDRVPEVKRNEYLLRDFCIARELPVKQYGEGPDIRFATTKYGREASLMPLFSQLKIRSLELIAPASTTPFSQSKGIKRKAQVAPAVAPAVAETFTESIAGSVEMTVADTSSPSSREVWKSLPTEKGTYYQPTPYFKLFLEQQTTYKTAAQQALEMQAVLSPGSSKKA